MSRAVMQLALEALENLISHDYHGEPARGIDLAGKEALDAITEALAQPSDSVEQEPVAWGVKKRGGMVWYVNDSRSVCQGYANHYQHRDANGSDQEAIPLYTSPPQRQPLTDAEILDLAMQSGAFDEQLLAFARAIEAAHGIKELK